MIFGQLAIVASCWQGSQRRLGSSSHSKTKHKFKKWTIKRLSKIGLRRCTKFDQAHSNDEQK